MTAPLTRQLAYYFAPLRDDDHAAQCGFSAVEGGGVPLDRGARLRVMGEVFQKTDAEMVQAALDYLQGEISRGWSGHHSHDPAHHYYYFDVPLRGDAMDRTVDSVAGGSR